MLPVCLIQFERILAKRVRQEQGREKDLPGEVKHLQVMYDALWALFFVPMLGVELRSIHSVHVQFRSSILFSVRQQQYK